MILSISVGIIVLFPEDFINSNDIHLNRAENNMKWIDTDSAKSYLLIRTGNPDRCESAFGKKKLRDNINNRICKDPLRGRLSAQKVISA